MFTIYPLAGERPTISTQLTMIALVDFSDKGSSINDATVCDNSTKASVIKSVTMGGGMTPNRPI